MVVLVGPADAAPGDLDPTFNGGTVLGPSGTGIAVVRQADGKLVVGGHVDTATAAAPNVDWRLARFNADGTPDPTFGVNGVVTSDRPGIERFAALALQADGRIVGAGSFFTANGEFEFQVARYNTNGSPDLSFGVGGSVTTGIRLSDSAARVAIQPDGRILVAGQSVDTASRGFALVRYNADGTLDTTFDTDGKVVTDLPGGQGTGAYGMALLSDGKIVASGCSGSDSDNYCSRFTLARYHPDGSLDTTFGANGTVVGPTGLRAGGGALAVHPGADTSQSKLVMAGGLGNGVQVVARFLADGALDATFDGDGVAGTVAGNVGPVLVDDEGRVVAAGSRNNRFLLTRYTSSGSPDASFGDGGSVTTSFGPIGSGVGEVIAQPDGKLVAAGVAEARYALARYVVAPSTDVADVSLAVTDAPDPVASSGRLTYTLTVSNAGPDPAFRLRATTAVPAGAAFVSATPTQGTCEEAAGAVTCDLNSLSAGQAATVAVVVNAGPPGTAVLSATASTSSIDNTPANNSATASTTVTPGAGAWTALPALDTPRSAPAVVLGDGRVLLAGGRTTPTSNSVITAVLYDPATGTSVPTANTLGTARQRHSATVLADGRVLVAGGVASPSGSALASAEIWDPGTNQWTTTGSMATGHVDHAAVLLDDGRVLVTGGMNLAGVCPGPAGVPNSAELYDPATGTWSSAGRMEFTRFGHTATKLADGRVLAVGGYLGTAFVGVCGLVAGQQNAPVELYDPLTNTWTKPADMRERRSYHAAVRLDDGSVLVAGGNPCNGICPTPSVERFDPAAGTWANRAPMAGGRSFHTLERLPNGKVLTVGGQATSSGPYLRPTELYDATANTWSPAGLVATGRVAPAVARSHNRVVLVGGVDTASTRTATVELWTPRPTISSLTPTSGGPGTTVTLTGTGLATIDTATFGTAATAALTPDPATPDTKATVVSPGTLNPAGGQVDVVVSGPGGPSATGPAALFTHPPFGYLRATTDPAVPAQITIDGDIADTWGTNWVAVPTGSHTVCFRRDVEGFTTPACQTVNVAAGQTTTVAGAYAPRGFLQVGTSPCCLTDAVISVRAPGEAGPTPRDNHTLYTDVAPGTYQVCWGPVAGLSPPACRDVVVTAGALTTEIGAYTAAPGAPGPPAGDGFLRVTTSPAVPAQIVVDGVVRDTWSLEWLRIAPGAHTVCFARDIEGFTTPGCSTVDVVADQTATVVGTYTPRGFLQVGTDPCCQSGAVISVDGVVRDNATVYTDLAPGTYTVCWGALAGRVAPPCRATTVTAGALTTVIGTYRSG